jgi:hypothetical protein
MGGVSWRKKESFAEQRGIDNRWTDLVWGMKKLF